MFAYIKDKSIFCLSKDSLKTKKVFVDEEVEETIDWEVVKTTVSVEKEVENEFYKDMIEVEFDNSISSPYWNWKKIVQFVSDEEKLQEKRKKKFEEFISAKSIEGFNWEWLELSGDDYNQLIVLRDFWGDKWAQMSTSMKKDVKDIYILVEVLKVPKEVVRKIYEEEIAIMEKLSSTRVALWLTKIDLSFLYD